MDILYWNGNLHVCCYGKLRYLFLNLAIINRSSYVKHPEIISDYFRSGQWQAAVLEVVYIIVNLTILPNYLIVSK